MKKIYLFLASAFIGMSVAQAQKENVGIGTTKPDASAILDLSSSSKGFLAPRVSLQQRNEIQNPATGLMIYQTDFLSGFYYFDGKEWKGVTNPDKSIAGTDGDWIVGGNNANPGDAFGTLNDQPIRMLVNGGRAGIISSQGAVYLGYSAGNTDVTKANIAIGKFSLNANTTGFDNTAVGTNALVSNTSGAANVAVGGGALQFNISGTSNMALGSFALRNVLGHFNTGIGHYVGFQTTGDRNTLIGSYAGNAKSGSDNVYIGYGAGAVNTDPSHPTTTSESGMLYISNNVGSNPLIKGNFSNKLLRINVGSSSGTSGTTSTAGHLAIGNFDSGTPMAIPAGYRLVVEEGILTEKIKVALKSSSVGGDWADYVFDENYKVMTLDAVEKYIKENKHLPNVPSTEEMLANGSDLIKTDAKLLEKIEELTLYMIDMNKQLKELKDENKQMKKQLGKK